jgi:kynurenine formamidase
MLNSRNAVALGILMAILVGANQIRAQETPIGPAWWPSEWGPDDERGAANRITPATVLRAARLIRDGKVYELGHLYVNIRQEVPGRNEEVHLYLLVRQGIYLLENMNLEQLSAERVYEFAFAFVPLKLKGAEGSPGNPIAIR